MATTIKKGVMNGNLLPVWHRLEIRIGTADTMLTLESATPFGAFHAGDLIDQNMWGDGFVDRPDRHQILRITAIHHLLTQNESRILHSQLILVEPEARPGTY